MENVPIRLETRRRCGYRKTGALYLMGDGVGQECGLLPLPLNSCPTCGAGIRQNRGFTWINPQALFAGRECLAGTTCLECTERFGTRGGLLWIGEKFYSTPGAFDDEARALGISRRIQVIPRGFEIGKTWVFLAHLSAIVSRHESCDGAGCEDCDRGTIAGPGIFRAFLPQRVEVVVDENTPTEEIERYRERGIEPVIVRPAENEAEPEPKPARRRAKEGRAS